MSIFETLFGSKAPAAAEQQQQQPPATTTTQQNLTGDPTVPGQPNPTTAQQSADPLAQYKELWQPPAAPQQQTATPPGFLQDAKAIAQTAQSVDYSKVVTPELMQQIQAGGEGATQALMQAMNAMSQASSAMAMQNTQQIVQKAVQETQQSFMQMLPSLIRNNAIGDTIKQDPILSNPATAPVVAAIAQQIAIKNPSASAEQVKQMANDYLLNFAKTITPAQQSSAKQVAEPDWSSYL